MKIDLTNTTYHARVERADRMKQVRQLRVGNPVATIEEYRDGRKGLVTLTDNGVVVVRNPNNNKIVTLYLATPAKAAAIYKQNFGSRAKMPQEIYNQIKINQIFFSAA